MSEEQLKKLQEYNLEYLEAQSSEEIFGGDYTSAVELKYAKKEIERLNNIIEDLLKRQNEALKYINNFLTMDDRYKHGNGNDELELVRRILNKHNKELKGSDSNE